jgi:hypothetical protein
MKKYRNTKISSVIIFATVVAVSSVVLAGEDVVMVGSNHDTLYVENTYTGSSSRTAIEGEAKNRANYGRGGCFSGGRIGVQGYAQESGSGGRYGVRGSASGGSSFNYGVYGESDGSHDYAGYFNGDVYTTGEYKDSDERLKDEISDLKGSLDQIMELKPKSFRFRTEEHPKKHLPEGYHMGLIAQDVEQIFPDLIREVPEPEDEDEGRDVNNDSPETFLATNYGELIPVLIGAIQEQQEQIADLQEQVAGCGCR